MTKAQLRTSLLAQRRRMTDKVLLDRVIAQGVLESEAYRKAGTVFLYASMPHEIDTRIILESAWQTGKSVALPRCEANHTMTFYKVDGETALRAGAYGIQEPCETCVAVFPQAGDLCIVPALAVDIHGNRLGFGGGYYDRFLRRFPIPTMALCYTLCDPLPTESWDVPMDSAMTASGQTLFKTNLKGGKTYG